MRNKFLFTFLLTIIFFCQKATAQSTLLPLPEVSTSDNPAWYFIQVVGSDELRNDLVFTAEGDFLYGKALNRTNDAQLFRFEKSGDNYFIINKLSGKKVDAGMEGGNQILLLTANGMGFSLDSIAPFYYNITASGTPTGGDPSKIWAHQGNNGSEYRIILVNTSWNRGGNSQFSFIPYEDLNLTYTNLTGDITWYSIESGGTNSGCITDVSALSADIKLEIEAYKEGKSHQLWRLVKNGTKTNFVNKATGNLIQTKSNVSENNLLWNYTQLTLDGANNNGFTLTHVRAGQYTLSGVEEDNITRYLTASNENEASDEYDASHLVSSNFTWKFVKREADIFTSLPKIQQEDTYFVYSKNRRVVVEGVNDYTVRTLQGVFLEKNTELPVGVYLVTVGSKTTKLFVK